MRDTDSPLVSTDGQEPATSNISHLRRADRIDEDAVLRAALTELPEVGASFLNFRLIAHLGVGNFGRVYLARQGDLADRLVALKITIELLGEEQKLAQLQH